MSASPRQGAVLIVMHADILPFRPIEAAANQTDTLLPTRTTTSSEAPLESDACLIGRDPTCQVRVDELRTDISRKHATIKREGPNYVLYDHSLHGTFINGQRINGLYRLTHDDIIGLANTREMLRFFDYNHSPSTAVVLTEREREILYLLAVGSRAKEIAEILVISQNTVNSHLKNLYEKLGASSKVEAISQARKLHLIE